MALLLLARRNAVRTFLLGTFILSLMTSIAFGGILDLYLKGIAPDPRKANEYVGSVETARGLTGLIVSFPIAILADKYGKLLIVRIMTCVGLVGISVCCYSVWTDSTQLIYVGICIFAIFQQSLMGLAAPILSDFVSKSNLTKTLARWQACVSLGFFVSPLIQIAIIAANGSEDKMKRESVLWMCHLILTVGMALFFLGVPLLWILPMTKTSDGREQSMPSGHSRELLLQSDDTQENEREEESAEGIGDVEEEVPVWHEELFCGIKKKWLIPMALEFMSFAIAIGSGMTFKFWPLFFEKDFNLNFLHISLIMSLTWASIICCTLSVPRLVKLINNTATTYLCLYCTGVALLFIIGRVVMPLKLTVFMVVLRNGIMNAGSPLTTSIVLNAVAPQHRAKWGAIASLTRATWAGSAFVGGMLSDHYDYRFAFTITAIIHVCAGIFFMLAIYPTIKRTTVVPRQNSDERDEETQEMHLAAGTFRSVDSMYDSVVITTQ
eukprot:GEMP01008586.1.p1 GENE.GEMP01008586.1~~GEMP01008586.1.p1  ORF type:complete len:494 (+),score=41.11 GEMP01008586.1:134-1615(+)